jgi:predicted PurR-regulated permease PerM
VRLTLDRFVRILLGVAAVVGVVWMVGFFSDLALYLLLGAVVAYLAGPLVTALQGRGLPRTPAVLLAFALVVGGLVVVVVLFVPFLGAQVATVTATLTAERVAAVSDALDALVRRYVPSVPAGAVEARLVEVSEALLRREQVTAAFSSALGVVGDVVAALVLVPFVAFFLLKDGRAIQARLLGLVPNRYFEPTVALLAEVEATIGRYFRALFYQMLSVGVVATLLLMAVGLDAAFAVGAFTALANTIPYFGPPLGFAAGALVGIAQTGDLSLVPGVAVAMGLTQVVDNVFFQPVYFSRAAKVHPLVILCAVLVGARLGGIVGMLVAIPALTVVLVTVRQVLWSLREYRLLNPSLRPPVHVPVAATPPPPVP